MPVKVRPNLHKFPPHFRKPFPPPTLQPQRPLNLTVTLVVIRWKCQLPICLCPPNHMPRKNRAHYQRTPPSGNKAKINFFMFLKR
ncbi:MAG: hypothetical protein N2035_09430 [Chthoniobacterales bacterium]|nr:hypothetical protein [Chthoniobacterales bacterium]